MEQPLPTVPPVPMDRLPGERDMIPVPGFQPMVELRAGDLCPACQEACLDYDGLLNLSCPRCRYTVTGGFT